MGKILVDFDAISYRNQLMDMKNKANQEYLKHKGTLTGISWESMRNAFDIALEKWKNLQHLKR